MKKIRLSVQERIAAVLKCRAKGNLVRDSAFHLGSDDMGPDDRCILTAFSPEAFDALCAADADADWPLACPPRAMPRWLVALTLSVEMCSCDKWPEYRDRYIALLPWVLGLTYDQRASLRFTSYVEAGMHWLGCPMEALDRAVACNPGSSAYWDRATGAWLSEWERRRAQQVTA